MGNRWFSRKSHPRRLASGKMTSVCGTIVCRTTGGEKRNSSYRHPCPRCSAPIVSVHMRRGGWVHFETGEGLTSTKHWCLHLGEGLGRGRDDLTLDLFNR